MRSIHFKFPEALFLRIEAQRKKDRLSPDRSEFIRRLLDLQLQRLEAADVRETSRRRPQVATLIAPTPPPLSDTPRSIQAGPEAVIVDGVPTHDVVIEIEMPDGSLVRGVPKNASPELQDEPDLGNASGAKGLLGTLS